MKRLLLIILLLLCCFAFPVYAEEDGDNATSIVDESITIDLGEGNGSLIIIGDNNVVYVPDAGENQCEIVHATRIDVGYVIVLPETEIVDDGIKTVFSRIVLFISDDGRAFVLDAEQ